MHRTLSLLLLSSLLLLLGACEPPPKENKKDRLVETPEGAPPAQAPTSLNPDSTLSDDQQRQLLARINNQDLTLGEYERRLNALAPFARARYNTPTRKKDFLDQMIQFEILAQEAQRRGLDRDPEVVLELKQAMVRKMMADQLSRDDAAQPIPPDEIRAWYDAHKDDYIRPAKVRASQIVLPDEPSARALLLELQAEFEKDPRHKRRAFALKARERSTDPATAKLGGDMRFFAHPNDGGTVDPKLADVAFNDLKDVGQVSQPFQTDKGWHILMLTARKQRYERTFDEVQRSIENRLRRERRSLQEQKFVDGLKATAAIQIKEDLLQTIPDPKLPEGQEQRPHGHQEGEDGHTLEVIRAPSPDEQDEALPDEDDEDPSPDKQAP
jgi:peptidyl-prolyl cis-trans isomerase C